MILQKPKRIGLQKQSGWCPGCGHGIVSRLLSEVVEDFGKESNLIMVHDVACGSLGAWTMNYDAIIAAHGRPLPTASGVKRVRPDALVCAYLGDGAAYSIGIAETIHSALRRENITVIVVNNTVYGMTGGQMAPTSIPGEVTVSSLNGKDPKKYGTLDVIELLKNLKPAYLERGELFDAVHIRETKEMIRAAFQTQIQKKGFSLVEVLAPCPTNLHMTPVDTKEWLHTEALKYLPVGKSLNQELEGSD